MNKLKYREKEELEDAIKTILKADEYAVENLEENHSKEMVKRVRSME